MKASMLSPTSEDKRIKYLWTFSVIAFVIVDFFVFFNAPGTGDIREHFVYWIDNVNEYGLRQGFIENADMYPPLSTILMYLGSRIFFFFENAQAIRAADMVALLVCGIWVIHKYDKPEYGFWMVVSCLVSVHLGFIDALVFPFLIIGFYYLDKQRYLLFAIFFSLCCCVKMQPLIIAPILFCYFVTVSTKKPYVSLPLRKVMQMALCVVATLLPFFLIYGIKPIVECIRAGLIAPGFSPNALNFIWIVQYFMELLFPEKTQPLINGLPDIYWGPHGPMLYFNYIFWLIFVALCIFTIFLKRKTPQIILKICIIEYTVYFLFKLAVHENHLILTMILTGILLCLEDTVINRWIFIFYVLSTNMNMYLFYNLTGFGSFHVLSIGEVPNSVIIAGINTIVLLGICVYLFIDIIKAQSLDISKET